MGTTESSSTSSASARKYQLVYMDQIEPVACPCGSAQRAFADDPDGIATFHITEIKTDSKTHYHKRMTEIYYVLEGTGHLEVDGERLPLRPGCAVMIKPGCRHRAVGQLKIINVPIPAFDADDEWFD